MGFYFLRKDDDMTLRIIQNSNGFFDHWSLILNPECSTGSSRDISIEVLGHTNTWALIGAVSSESDNSVSVDGVKGKRCEWSVLVSMLVLFWGAILFSFLLLFASFDCQNHVDGGKIFEISCVNCIFIFKIFSFVDKANQLGCNSFLFLNLLFKWLDALLRLHVKGQLFVGNILYKDLHLVIFNYFKKC